MPHPRRSAGAYFPDTGRWARRWINLWRMASATPDLRLPSQPKLVLNAPTHAEGWAGWVDLGGRLHAEIVYPSKDGHPPGTNRPRRRVTTLIETNALRLSQTANHWTAWKGCSGAQDCSSKSRQRFRVTWAGRWLHILTALAALITRVRCQESQETGRQTVSKRPIVYTL